MQERIMNYPKKIQFPHGYFHVHVIPKVVIAMLDSNQTYYA